VAEEEQVLSVLLVLLVLVAVAQVAQQVLLELLEPLIQVAVVVAADGLPTQTKLMAAQAVQVL
jgi:hypothetical protein